MKTHPKIPHPNEFKEVNAPVERFNRRVAVGMGKVLGNMWFFYFCVLLDVAELPAVVKAHSTIAWISYVSQTVIQLLALPVLQVYQNIQQEHNDAKADADHQSLVYLATIQDEQLEILKELQVKKHGTIRT